MSTYPALTFGLEFELLVKTLKGNLADPEPEDKRPVTRIDDVLSSRQANLKVRDFIGEAFEKAGVPHFITKGDYSKWMISSDPTVEGKGEGKLSSYTYEPIEIVSPILTRTPRDMKDIKKVLDVLNTKFRVTVNETCGFHVHFGNGKREGDKFPLRVVQNVIALFWTLEPAISAIHPDWRTDVEYSRALRRHAVIVAVKDLNNKDECDHANHLDAPAKKSTAEVLQTDYETTDITKLVALTKAMDYSQRYIGGPLSRSGHYLAVNLENLLWKNSVSGSAGRTKHTIEFRQHAGTLDHSAVVGWVKLLHRLMESATMSSENDLSTFLEINRGVAEGMKGLRHDIVGICKSLRAENLAAYYKEFAGQFKHVDLDRNYEDDLWVVKRLQELEKYM